MRGNGTLWVCPAVFISTGLLLARGPKQRNFSCSDDGQLQLANGTPALARWIGKQSFILLGRFAAHQIK
jgi:hypothetical protein